MNVNAMPLKNLLHASILMTLKCHKHGHVHIGNARIQRGGGGGREPGTPWKTTSSIGFYRKMQFDAITLKKVGPPEICDPLSGFFKNYSFFEITLVPNCKIC